MQVPEEPNRLKEVRYRDMREIEAVKQANGKVKYFVVGLEGWSFDSRREAEEAAIREDE